MVKYTMGCESLSSIEITEKLMEMGFEKDAITVALEVAGPSFEDVIVYLSDKSCSSGDLASRALRKGTLFSSQSSHQTRQSSILEHFLAKSVYKQKRNDVEPVESSSDLNELPGPTKMEYCEKPHFNTNDTPKSGSGSYPGDWQQELCHEFDWETKASYMLQIHFGYSSLKKFQKEALSAWVVHQDCLVLAATGSGKSLCFQIPTLLTGKVVVVISPLISLMHDQCLKLAKHGISACFLGSGQPDSSVEKKAMGGMYSIIYVCPETVLRLIQPLQRLAETRGIALFAIDEVHCVSKWGHDFRPDYRRLSVLRENFSCCNLKFLKFDIPLMALTATATNHVREDILKSLCMSKETKIVLTSFFRSNLRFSVKHSRTSSPSSYEKDFGELIHFYTRKRQSSDKTQTKISRAFNVASDVSTINSEYGTCGNSSNNLKDIEDCCSNDDDNDDDVDEEVGLTTSKRREMTVEYLENEVDVFQGVDDWDVSCGEFFGQASRDHWDVSMPLETTEPLEKLEERSKVCHRPLEHGPTIIYVPTRKETLSIAKYLSQFGVKAAAYNASLPKSHLRKVHEKFHENTLEVVVATIAFGMGIDKLNVRRIIHYGWPQSLEAYYQEAGRAGRDGKLADCILFANLARIPSLLPSRRSEEQLNRARKMLADCFRYGMNTSCCRAKELVEYFGESFKYDRCLMCDVCVKGPPQLKDCKEEVDLLMQVIAAYNSNSLDYSFDDFAHEDPRQRSLEKLTLKVFVSKIREQSTKFVSTDLLWWKGLARILEGRGYLKEGDKKSHVQLKFPECTKLGLECLSKMEETFFVYPQADMLLSTQNRKSYSSFSEWGSGWADLEIRRQRLKMMKQFTGVPREPKRRKGRRIRRHKPDLTTARGRITARLSKNM